MVGVKIIAIYDYKNLHFVCISAYKNVQFAFADATDFQDLLR